VNLILFNPEEWGKPLVSTDPRAEHIRKVLRLAVGDTVRVGKLLAGTGFATVLQLEPELVLSFPQVLEPAQPRVALELVLGHVRPLVMQRLFKDLSASGLAGIRVVDAGLTEASYFKSSFWAKNEYQDFLLQGAMQGGDVSLPEVSRYYGVARALEALDQIASPTNRLAARFLCHPAPDVQALPLAFTQALARGAQRFVVAVGPERGWQKEECTMFEQAGFMKVGMGKRILRTEQAASVVAALAGMYLGA